MTATLAPGTTALLGVNGAGKSTMLSAAGGVLRPSAGRVLVDGMDLWSRSTRKEALRAVALMPQTTAFPPGMTAEEVVTYLAWLKGVPRRAARTRAREVLEEVGLGPRMRTRMSRLSGGMARRVAFAQALAPRPRVLLLDEPTTGLDPAQRHAMVELVRGLSVTGVSVLLSSHVVEDVEDLATDVIVLHEGTLRFWGPVGDLAALGDAGARRSPVESGFFRVIGSEVGR
ncbi:ABC transporter ATP-binding protein [Phycicoccus endophyticus]|uniref:ABC transporter ATP-binding protein n=1 Tax=Phycicoccus endophyticus TaxID=1690220 RepID=A0A7G9QYI0_9MICO|nr:ABC transporter ATP-binding protein [Phycicoccus endophyticus]NHI19304.1 ABC transporter ATP-binding protein [Phycicoccus endophyticus]QNN48405.1 ABC transporter ATP-binding protein [Phycicoccus endophyticus]